MEGCLRSIAALLGKDEALTCLLGAQACEEAGDCIEAVALYKKSYRLWPALDSVDQDGLPVGVRREAEAAGLDLVSVAATAAMQTDAVPRFDMQDEQEWLAYLEEHGYCVLAAVADAAAVQQAHELIWDFLEAGPDASVLRADPSTWEGPAWLPSASNGLLGGGGFGQSDFMWHTRLVPGVREAFARIWQRDDLIVSYDGGNVFRPWRSRPEWRTEGSWWHVDENAWLHGLDSPLDGRQCVQGFVTFTDATAETGGLCVVPGSHKHHRDVCERACSWKRAADFVPVHSADPALQSGTLLVRAKAGDLVLWDSRCVHCNTPGQADAHADAEVEADVQAELLRLVGYVCMTPTEWATTEVLKKRKDAFVNNQSANHQPHELHALEPAPAWMLPQDWASVPEEQRRLIVGDVGVS